MSMFIQGVFFTIDMQPACPSACKAQDLHLDRKIRLVYIVSSQSGDGLCSEPTNSCISQIIRQWIPDCWFVDRKSTASKGAVTNEQLTTDRSYRRCWQPETTDTGTQYSARYLEAWCWRRRWTVTVCLQAYILFGEQSVKINRSSYISRDRPRSYTSESKWSDVLQHSEQTETNEWWCTHVSDRPRNSINNRYILYCSSGILLSDSDSVRFCCIIRFFLRQPSRLAFPTFHIIFFFFSPLTRVSNQWNSYSYPKHIRVLFF